MRSEATVEGALAARTQFNQGGKVKKYEKNEKENSVFDSPKTTTLTQFKCIVLQAILAFMMNVQNVAY
ncbi:hypothetical protein Scep_025419 [Stephania cephalantha]|uniref:Uncharacterized protein n=1 Tax=Stephania cephalantha TaxID=152367 RepID=A0AAP0EKQ7_9MAGN